MIKYLVFGIGVVVGITACVVVDLAVQFVDTADIRY